MSKSIYNNNSVSIYLVCEGVSFLVIMMFIFNDLWTIQYIENLSYLLDRLCGKLFWDTAIDTVASEWGKAWANIHKLVTSQ